MTVQSLTWHTASSIPCTWQCRLIRPQMKQPQNISLSSLIIPWRYLRQQQKQSQPLDHPSKFNTTVTVTPLEKFTETASLLISHTMSTIIEKRKAARVTNTTESTYLIKKHTQTAEFSVVTAGQSKQIKSVDVALLRMVPQGDPDLTSYLNELLRTKEPEQQNMTFWFLTPESPGKPEDHTPIQTRILKLLTELKDKENLNPQENKESRKNFLKRSDWTDTLLTET